MVEDDAYCIDVIRQLQAVQSAIERVNALLLQDHLQSCVTTAIRGEAPAERERVVGELLSLFEQGARAAESGATFGPDGGNGACPACASGAASAAGPGDTGTTGTGES